MRKAAGAGDRFEGLAEFSGDGVGGRRWCAGPGEEGTFTICSFWLVSALTEIEVSGTRALCEKLLAYASPLLYARGDRPARRAAPGELPQAFLHLA